MTVKKIGRGLMIAGALGIGLAILVPLLMRNENSRSIQILAIEVSAIVILVGVMLPGSQTTREIQAGKTIRALALEVLNLPIVIWVLAGFLLVYVLLLLAPMFLSPGLQMNYLTGYIPNLNPIGNDLGVMVDLIEGWVAGNQSPYTIQFYPPLTYIFFAPLLLFRDDLSLYRFFTLFTFLSYCVLTFLLPLKMIERKYFPLLLLLFITGLFSYGFQFELERGQYNVFTFLLCLTSIYLFHGQPRYRLLAYLLFSLAVQLKLYPAIFIVMLVDDWRDWKNNLLRFAGIALFNLLLFFVMGFQIFLDFIRSVTAQVVSPSWIGLWNHSISSFISMAKQNGFGLVGLETLRMLRRNEAWFEGSLILAFALLFLSALVIFHLRKKTGLDPYLLMTCTIGALILPISYDYTLSILAAPMLLLLAGIPEVNDPLSRLLSILLVLATSIIYFATLIPYPYRPDPLHNSFPLLFLILILVTALNFLRYYHERVQSATPRSAAMTVRE